MSSFDYGVFTGDDNVFAVSKSMFSEAEADKLFVREQELPLERARKITGWVYFGIGYDEDNVRCVGYWFSNRRAGRYPQEVYAYIY